MEKEKTPGTVSYFEHERVVAIMERHVKRLFILCIIIFVALIGTNLGWIMWEAQYEDVVMTETTQDGEGTNIISAGDVSYGTEN